MQTMMMGANLAAGVGTIASGYAKASEASAEAAQLGQNANAQIAASQRSAFLTRQRTRAIQSRQTALAAASGAGATDPTIVNLEAETGREGEYAALTDLYNGQSEADAMRFQARMTRFAGDQAFKGGLVDAASTIIGGQGSILQKYGGKLPDWMGGAKLPGFDMPAGG